MKNRILHINDILDSQRIDVGYYMSDIGGNNFVSLSKYVNIKGGKRIPKGETFSFEKTSYLYLRLSDITDFDNINFNDLKCISEELYNKLQRYEIKDNTIVFSIAGTIGRVFVVKNIPKGKRIILTENCAMLFPKNEHVLPDYVSILLNCSFVQKQIEQKRIMTTIPKIGLDRIAKLKVPEIPSLDVQLRIISIYQDAVNKKFGMKNKVKELSNSIDEYLIQTLGILRGQNKMSRSIILNCSDIIGKMFIAQQSEPYICKSHKTTKLSTVAHIDKGQSITKKDIENGEIPVIAGGMVSPYSHNKSNYSGNIITVSASGANSGYVWYHENPIFASDCSVIYSKNENDFRTPYIYLMLRFQQEYIYSLQRGAGQPHVYATDLKDLKLPIISIHEQDEIIRNVLNIKNQIEQFLEAENKLLNYTKQRIEQLILG